MKRIIACLFVVGLVFTMFGCATLNTPKDAPPDVKKAAMCADAKAWLATIDAGMKSASIGTDAYKWYAALRPAAEVAVNSYCGVPVVQ